MDSGGPRKALLHGVQNPDPHANGQFWGKVTPGHAQQHSAVSCAKMAEPVEMPFGLWTLVGPRKHVG